MEMQELSFMDAKRNLNRQGTKVLHDIVNAYQTGVFDDPKASSLFCSLLACICEGKVQGVFDDATAMVKWSLTKEYSDSLEILREAVVKAGFDSGNLVRGPWSQ